MLTLSPPASRRLAARTTLHSSATAFLNSYTMGLFRRRAQTDEEVLKQQEKKEKVPFLKRPASASPLADARHPRSTS